MDILVHELLNLRRVWMQEKRHRQVPKARVEVSSIYVRSLGLYCSSLTGRTMGIEPSNLIWILVDHYRTGMHQ